MRSLSLWSTLTTYYIRAGLETIFLVDACECQPVKASRGRLPPSQARPRHILVFVARCSGGGGGGDQFASQTGTLAQAGPWTTSTTTTAVMAHCHSHHQGWEHSGFNQTQTSTQIKLWIIFVLCWIWKGNFHHRSVVRDHSCWVLSWWGCMGTCCMEMLALAGCSWWDVRPGQ